MYNFGMEACNFIAELLAKGVLIPGPIKLLPDGLSSVEEGLRYMRDGKVEHV